MTRVALCAKGSSTLPTGRSCEGTHSLAELDGLLPVDLTDGSAVNAPYDHDVDCGWLICASTSVPSNRHVQVSVTRLDTQLHTDVIHIFDGTTRSAPELTSSKGISGTSPPLGAFRASGRCLLVTFRSDSSVAGTGWTVRALVAAGEKWDGWGESTREGKMLTLSASLLDSHDMLGNPGCSYRVWQQ